MSKNLKHKLSDDLMRVSTKEVDDIIHQLEHAFSDGRLNEQDFDDRMKKALEAKTRGELLPLTRDLAQHQASSLDMSAKTRRRLNNSATAIFSGIEQKGPFILPKTYRITAIMGGCVLDLSNAKFESHETEIHVTAIMGGIEIYVPKGIRVHLNGTPIFGGFSQKLADELLPNDAPILSIHGIAIFGGVDIRRVS